MCNWTQANWPAIEPAFPPDIVSPFTERYPRWFHDRVASGLGAMPGNVAAWLKTNGFLVEQMAVEDAFLQLTDVEDVTSSQGLHGAFY